MRHIIIYCFERKTQKERKGDVDRMKEKKQTEGSRNREKHVDGLLVICSGSPKIIKTGVGPMSDLLSFIAGRKQMKAAAAKKRN